MQLNSQEIETFQNFPVALKRGLEKVAHVERVLASVKRLTDKQMNPKLSRMSPGFFSNPGLFGCRPRIEPFP